MTTVKLKIDGQEIEVPSTKTAYDPLYKKTVEIPTTIYDAAIALSQKTGRPNPIPVLCHREHINPVAVCRVCVVDLYQNGWLNRVQVPACNRAVEEGMDVRTAASSERVQTTVKVVTQLLLADRAPGHMPASGIANELEEIARRFQVPPSPFPKPEKLRPRDNSSLVIAVDHNACILCDRCVRACNEIRENHVIGRAGKGYQAHIAFDLDDPMGESSCVSCGECAISCPTGALLHRSQVQPDAWKSERPAPAAVPAEELARHPLFEGVSVPFLKLNEGSVVRRHYKKGDVICREGEYGFSAYLIEKGKVRICIASPISHAKSNKKQGGTGWFGLVQRFTTGLFTRAQDRREEEGGRRFIHIDAPVALEYDNPAAFLEAGDLFGEMACMNNYPRSATVVAEEDCVVLEMLRNVLYILQRNRKSREILDDRYRRRSIDNHLRSVPLFADVLTDPAEFARFVDFVRPRVRLRRLPPGEVLFRQGDFADAFYMVRIGFVKVSQNWPGGEQVLTYIGPGGYFGEIGLLSHLAELDQGNYPAGVRTATCTALDHVDVVELAGTDFAALLENFPNLKQHLLGVARQRLEDNERARQEVESVQLGEFLRQGLMNAQSLLVLDLEKCTRCDECTKACSDSHDGVTRLIREGLRFDKWLVASSCRACLDPYCMVGCPVDSIHRRNSREMIIEDWCIGCGNCANNCPYGNINMHEFAVKKEDPAQPGRKIAAVQAKATMCDLCTELDGYPSCVYACPHDAAHRMTGPDLKNLVQGEVRSG